MALIEINKNPSRRDLRLFAGLWLPLFGALLGIARAHHAGSIAAGERLWVALGGASLVCLLSVPIARRVYVGLSYATWPIGLVVSEVLLLVVFFCVVTPLGLFLRAFGHDAMTLRFDRTATSYWIKRGENDDLRRYFRQF